MGFQVTFEPGKQRIQVAADETVLDAALRQGFGLPYDCRSGRCGSCRATLLDGEIDYLKPPTALLDEAVPAPSTILLCCARARSDLVLDCPQVVRRVGPPPTTFPARVHRLHRVAPDVMIVELKISAPGWSFVAGQYVDILLPEGRRRAFSLASRPRGDGILELHIRRIAGGRFTGHVFEAMKERDILRLRGPLGRFFLRQDSEKPALLVAGGTGFAPIKAIIEESIARGSRRPLHLFWGARDVAGLYLGQLAEQWAIDHTNMRFTPVLSDSPDAERWCGRRGLVHEAVLADCPDLSGNQVYVCGAPAMIEVARRDFIARGRLPVEEFFADAFDFADDP
ncbi:MAG TPA: CDP-6-deoxy-delta-3,4-glucoseen reductase [Accumulibacter sp.]|nr:CDP-6-deoxy-delta-3,4-glucoseen reductase [Accumulibacter sp.]HMW16546.1 CDP-6-deoxy-delta-3,4-glucoseen reductase [Accumulibacter sp.]HMX21350.1 CDP-6-deoxy-delta-3,4-glucoseen reductase [Accumulibacter sp.]HMY06636.1 CDP-6-deoxy-delta-3,4-glucoseen reductase [Accumulibacter sp.]HNC18129.1 CDP-6-deoxy-delta-3,4-glucoseen reductase [Accumulibacter sp.]